ncbi:hypothetical protein NBC122_02050 [Chryseobacterium salivictor]|uniref:Uncharacterized protein n=1 Tax=Chryseobacterium salivictor TaxID=2547600 RepID=A0A4P6ZH21_9FLAO|nr:hypothetical protein NBC122_02050 [Chryseobacterium salivictor]
MVREKFAGFLIYNRSAEKNAKIHEQNYDSVEFPKLTSVLIPSD